MKIFMDDYIVVGSSLIFYLHVTVYQKNVLQYSNVCISPDVFCSAISQWVHGPLSFLLKYVKYGLDYLEFEPIPMFPIALIWLDDMR